MDPVLSVIDEALNRTGLTDAAVSKLAVGNYALLKNMRAARGDEKRYSFQALEQVARVLDLECYFGPKRKLLGFSEGVDDTDLSRQMPLRAGFVPIPWHRDAKRAGSAPIAFSQLWLEANGLVPDFLQAIVPENSLVSFLDAKNTVAVLNTSSLRKAGTGLWGIRDGGQITIARVAFSSDVAVILPSSEQGDARILIKADFDQLQVLGKVVWTGQNYV